jgi:hypothetical protein
MSAKGNKAKAIKEPTPKRAPSASRIPVRSPIDDGMRSQMFNLPTSLQYRSRRSNSPLVPGLADPLPKKRKAKVSLDNTSASAADKSSSAEDTTISASAANKSSSAEDTPTHPLGIRLSEAIDQRLLQLSSSKIPEKEHSASEGDKGPSSESGNSPLAARKSSRACSPWGDSDDEEETKSSNPPKIDGENTLPPALRAEDSLANRQTGLVPVSERHKFKTPSSSAKMNARHGLCESTDEDDDPSPSPVHASSTEKILDEVIERTTAYREYIRSGGVPENNEQWTAHLAKNLAEETRRTKSPPRTRQSHELEVEGALLRPTLPVDPPSRIPLELRLTEEELRLREARKALGRITSLVSSVMNDESLRVTVDPMSSALRDLNESLQVVVNVDDDLMNDAEFNAARARFNDVSRESSSAAIPAINCSESTDEDRAQYSAFLNANKAPLAPTEPVLDMTGKDDEEDSSKVLRQSHELTSQLLHVRH